MHADLQKFGYLIAEDKCIWDPCQILPWLGYIWNTYEGSISVNEARIERLMVLLGELLSMIGKGQLIFPVRKIARLVGQLISMQTAIGSEVRLRTRSLYQSVTSRASWEAPVKVSHEAVAEIEFWRDNVRVFNKAELRSDTLRNDAADAQTVVSCDASGAGFGGYLEGEKDSQVIGCWSESECELSSTWRELEAVHRVLNSKTESLEGQTVLVQTDNKNVVGILKVGSKKAHLQKIAINVDDFCKKHNIKLESKWIPRENNVEADFYSRCTDSNDWSLENHIFVDLDKKWGPYTCEMFACSYN